MRLFVIAFVYIVFIISFLRLPPCPLCLAHFLYARLPQRMLLYSAVAYGADSSDDSNVFQIGKIETIEIKGSKPSGIPDAFGAESISAQSMQDNFARDVGQALQNVTGVAPTFTGQRAESQVYIRGFNQNQVTLSVDGIPIYVPYDGNVDLSRLLTANLSEIVVTKGLGSLMYGPNNMGGTINLITKRPDKPFALDVSGGVIGNQDGIDANNGSAQFGSRLNDRWYVTGGFAFNNSTGFPLSGDFTPVAAQPSGARLNATSHAQNYNFKVGFTPNATDEYALAVSEVISMKQDPPYTGKTAVTGQKAAYWDWPQWNKQSYYFIGNTGIGAGYLKTRVYLDRFINQLDSYDNATYSTTFKPYAFNSEYNDHSEGVNLEFGQAAGQRQPAETRRLSIKKTSIPRRNFRATPNATIVRGFTFRPKLSRSALKTPGALASRPGSWRAIVTIATNSTMPRSTPIAWIRR